MFLFLGSLEAVVSRVLHLSSGRLRVADDARARRRPRGSVGVKPWVWPETRLSAPGVDGPNVVLYELSLIAKCWA